MKPFVFRLAFLATVIVAQDPLLAQGTNPGSMDLYADPRQQQYLPFEPDQRTTADVLREAGLKPAPPIPDSAPSPSWNGDLYGQMVLAVGDDDVSEAVRLIGVGVDLNADVAGNGITPLMISQSPAMVTAFLRHGADPNRRDTDGATALHHLIFAERAEEIVPLLLDAGADVNAVAKRQNDETPLLAARQLFFEGGDVALAERIVRLLHRAGASVDAQDSFGYTALITAAVNDKPRLARLILSLGADPHVPSADGMTALAWSRQLGHHEIETILLQFGAKK